MKFHHIGVSSNDIEKEFLIYKKLGYHKVGQEFIDPVQKIKGVFIEAEGQPRLELLCDINDSGPVAKHLKQNNKLYHMAYAVDNIEQALLDFQDCYCLVPPIQASYFKRVCFLMLRNKFIIELVEER